MTTLWIIVGCIFLTGIGIRFTFRVMGLNKTEAFIIFILVIMLVSVNTVPVRQLIALFY